MPEPRASEQGRGSTDVARPRLRRRHDPGYLWWVRDGVVRLAARVGVLTAPTLGLLAALPACDGPAGHAAADAGPPGEHIAIAGDFRDFRSWERIPIDATALPTGMTGGPAYVYANRRAPEGASRFDVGTILVKTVEAGDPTTWTIHAMVKRGVPYNSTGTIGWEFFELRLEPDGEPVVLWRGTGPTTGHGYGRPLPDGGVLELVCNDCHAAAWSTDGVLTPALAPGRP